MINSVDEIDMGMLSEGYDELDEVEREYADEMLRRERENKKYADLAKRGFGYWLDNCGDGEWYCKHCLQPECGKRMAPRIL